MAPSQIRDATLSQLRQTYLTMTSPEWVLDLDDGSQAVQQDAAVKLLSVHHARLVLENAELADIRDKLMANEDDLETGRKAVAKALKKLEEVQAVLDAVAGFLSTVAKVLPLLGIAVA